MDLPTVLYRCPGPHSRNGGTYEYLGVETPEAHEAATANGWQLTMPLAIDAYENQRESVMAEVAREVEAESITAEPVRLRAKPGPKPKPKD